MKFKGMPNNLVRITKVRPHLVRKIPKAIRFDANGEYETENPYLIKRLSTKFEIVEDIIEEIVEVDHGLQEENEEEAKVVILDKELTYKELQVLYAEKTGESAVGKKKVDLIKELEV